MEEYDPAHNTWTAKAPMTTGRSGLGLAAASNGKLYAIGGVNLFNKDSPGVVLNVVEEYDPATDSWITKTPLPTKHQDFGLATTSNGRLYATGGTGVDAANIATLEEYTP